LDVNGVLNTTADATIHGVTVGRGGGNSTQNVAFGVSALLNNTGGVGIVAVGEDALKLNTTGTANTAVGRYSLINNTTGNANTAVGKFSAYYTTGSDNSAFGFEALGDNTIGFKNTAIGFQAGKIMQDGSNNTFIGAGSDVNSSSSLYNNSTALGYNAIINDSNQVVLGGQPSGGSYPGVKIPGSYVGINGVYNPASGYALDVSGNTNIAGNFYISQTDTTTGTQTSQQLGYTVENTTRSANDSNTEMTDNVTKNLITFTPAKGVWQVNFNYSLTAITSSGGSITAFTIVISTNGTTSLVQYRTFSNFIEQDDDVGGSGGLRRKNTMSGVINTDGSTHFYLNARVDFTTTGNCYMAIPYLTYTKIG
jgi:hypothetical protein